VKPELADNKAPHAEFEVACPNPDLTCTFTDKSKDDDGNVTTWEWDFGDGTGSILQNPSHTFAEAKTYKVTLKVTDDRRGTDEKTKDANPKAVPPPSNRSPTASADNATTSEDVAVTIAVLANDNDPDGDPLTPSIQDQAQHGTASVNGDGSITYTPAANYNGSDGFTYRVSDGRGGTSDPANVQISVTAVNDPPVANDDAFTATQAVPLSVDAPGVLSNDTDPDGSNPSAIPLTTTTANGGAVSLQSDGSFIYTSGPLFTGTDTFTYSASDGTLTSTSAATVTITVNALSVGLRQ
jgi:large repetitive protein